jgi:hypothetical protein
MRGFCWTDRPSSLGGRQLDIKTDRGVPDEEPTVLVLIFGCGRLKTADVS